MQYVIWIPELELVSLVAVNNKKELFWAIDELGCDDPWSCFGVKVRRVNISFILDAESFIAEDTTVESAPLKFTTEFIGESTDTILADIAVNILAKKPPSEWTIHGWKKLFSNKFDPA